MPFYSWLRRAIPESFRWYIANDKPEKAKVILETVAKCNRKQLHNIDRLTEKQEVEGTKRYTFLDLLKSRTLVKILFLSSLNWYVSYLPKLRRYIHSNYT